MKPTAARKPNSFHCWKGRSPALLPFVPPGISLGFTATEKSGPAKSRVAGFVHPTRAGGDAGLSVTTRLAETGAFGRTFSTTPKTASRATGRAGVTTADW